MTRRQLLRLVAALPGLGMCGCAAPGGVGLKRSEEETLAGGRSGGSRLVPVLAIGGNLPSRSDLKALINGRADSGGVQEIAAAAADTGWPLTLHLDGPDVGDLSRLCTAVPRASIVWAHAGTTPPQFGGGAPPAT